MKKINVSSKVTLVLFALYLLALVWLVIFKLQYNLSFTTHVRDINLMPFYEETIKDMSVYINDKIFNTVVFIPFGVYIAMLWRNWSFVRKIIPVFLTSLSFEIVQFVFSIGATDINDLIQNTLGGVIGVGLFTLLEKVFKARSYLVVNTIAAIVFVMLIIFRLRLKLQF